MLNSCLRCLRLSGILFVVSLTSIMATAQTATPQPEADRVILVISAEDGDPKLYTIDPETRDRELFLDLTAFGRLDFAALSPDGTKLAFIAFEEAEWLNTLYILDMQTGEATQIRIDRGDIGELNWSADSTQLTYLANGINGDFYDIFRYNVSTQDTQALKWHHAILMATNFDSIKTMRQSPDGQKFLFSLTTAPPDTFSFFVTTDSNGTQATLLPIDNPGVKSVTWDNQSESIYYTCIEIYGDSPSICNFNFDSGAIKQILKRDALQVVLGQIDYGILSINEYRGLLVLNFSGDGDIYITNTRTQDIAHLLDNVTFKVEIVGWIDRPTKAPSTVDN